jgi:hypothetical protein
MSKAFQKSVQSVERIDSASLGEVEPKMLITSIETQAEHAGQLGRRRAAIARGPLVSGKTSLVILANGRTHA